MYSMKHVTASDARKQWFRLLDDVVAGEVVAVARKGSLVVLRRRSPGGRSTARPSYRSLLRVPDADAADRWSWQWQPDGNTRPRPARRR